MVAIVNPYSIDNVVGKGDLRDLLAKIHELGGTIKLREMGNFRRQWQNSTTAEMILRTLARAGYGEVTMKVGPNGGRPALQFRLFDTGAVRSTPENREIPDSRAPASA